MTSILDSKYVEPTRPYSQKELKQKRNNLFKSLRLGDSVAHHQKCDHFYFVKEHGRKEREMKEKNSDDVGNCSICWKMSKTPNNYKEKVQGLVDEYYQMYQVNPSYLTYQIVDLESVFYKWLYQS